MDSISSLPNELICHIASFLSAKEAAFSLVLSKRWLNLFTIIPNLHFSDWVENPGTFAEFVGRLVALPPSSRVRKVTLVEGLRLVAPDDYVHVDRCLCNVVKRGVLDIELDVKVDIGNSFEDFVSWYKLSIVRKPYSLPVDVFTCKTLVVLKLGAYVVIDVLPENALLPSLKNLILDSVGFYHPCGYAFQTLLSACPVLEDLVIFGVKWELRKWSCIVSSPTLQRLTINRIKDFRLHGCDYGSITFDTPKLVYLEYGDFVPEEYPIVNLDSLVEAKLDLVMTSFASVDGLIPSNPTNLFMV